MTKEEGERTKSGTTDPSPSWDFLSPLAKDLRLQDWPLESPEDPQTNPSGCHPCIVGPLTMMKINDTYTIMHRTPPIAAGQEKLQRSNHMSIY